VPNLNLVVAGIKAETELIRTIILKSSDGQALPPFTAGAHLEVAIPEQKEPRCYSLVCMDDDGAEFDAPQMYRLGVRLEHPSAGGSRYMHGLQPGDRLKVEGPRNDFPLHDVLADAGEVVLIAGGIGITPIASMATTLKRRGRRYTLHYYGRRRSQMSFLDALAQQHGDALRVHADDEAASHAPVPALLDALQPEQHLYVCGPKGLIDVVIEEAQARHWPKDRIHFELFVTAAPQFGDRAFDVELRQSGRVLHVPANKTILEVLEEAGCDPLFDCRRGECGVCQATVLEGKPDHRDYYLSEAERAAGDVMQICISRSLSDRLVLDL
jgi:vanillate O-demethylase ferredoxin subunit